MGVNSTEKKGKNMPHENHEPLENPQNQPHTHPEEHLKPKCDCGPDCHCGCQEGKHCICGGKCKHKGAKLVAALIIFFAGFGLAMACRCAKHSGSGCPHHHCAMMKQHAMMTPNYADGAGNVIIINTDGTQPTMYEHRQAEKMGKMPRNTSTNIKSATPVAPMVDEEEFD